MTIPASRAKQKEDREKDISFLLSALLLLEESFPAPGTIIRTWVELFPKFYRSADAYIHV
jgi:hypothetical protein